MMQYADLHIHSNYSDGLLSPEEIIDKAKDNGVKCISITDHDTIASQYITENKYQDIEIIPGVEFSTEYDNMEIHILGYYIDINNKNLQKTIQSIQQKRYKRTLDIINKLSEIGIDISIDDLDCSGSTSFGRGNIASAVSKKGYAKSYKEAFIKYLDKGKAAYIKGEKLSYKEVLWIIKESNGISVIAHPGKIYRKMAIEGIVKEFKCYGLNGIEVYHASHNLNERNYLYSLAMKHKLLVTGGSDFHNCIYAESAIGKYGIDKEKLDKIKKIKYRL